MGRREAEGGPDPLFSLWFCLRQSWACRTAGGGLQMSLPVWRERHTILVSGQPHLSSSGPTGDPPPRQGPWKACPLVWGPRGGWKPFSDPSHFPLSRRDLQGAGLCARCPPITFHLPCSALPGRRPVCLPGHPLQGGFLRGAGLLGICRWEPHGARGVLPGQGERNRLQVTLRGWERGGPRGPGPGAGAGQSRQRPGLRRS